MDSPREPQQPRHMHRAHVAVPTVCTFEGVYVEPEIGGLNLGSTSFMLLLPRNQGKAVPPAAARAWRATGLIFGFSQRKGSPPARWRDTFLANREKRGPLNPDPQDVGIPMKDPGRPPRRQGEGNTR